MRSLIITLPTALLMSGIAGVLSAQSRIEPGQMARGSKVEMYEVNSLSGALSPLTPAKVEIASVADTRDRVINRAWIASMFTVIGASSLDAATSWGKNESNFLLASPGGTFGAKGLSLKAGLATAVLVPQIVFRKHKNVKTGFAIFNFGDAALFSAVAIHNLGIPAARN